MVIPERDVGRLLEAYLPCLQAGGPLSLPPRLAERVAEDVPPRPVLTLSEESGTLVASLQFAYGDGPPQVRAGMAEPELVELAEGAAGLEDRSARQRWARRDRRAEEAAHARLLAAGLVPAGKGVYTAEGEAALDFLCDHLPLLAAEWEAYGAEDLRHLRVVRSKPRSSARLTTGIDWLDLELSLDYGEGRLETAEILTLLWSGARWVRLGNGRYLRLPEGWAEEQRRLLADLDEPRLVGGRLRLARWDAAAVHAWLQAADERQADETWHALSALAEGFDGIRPAPLPASLRAELRPYSGGVTTGSPSCGSTA